MGTLGLESLTALELRRLIESGIGMRVSALVLWIHSTVTALTRHLLSKLYEKPAPQEKATAPDVGKRQAIAILGDMSDEDALRALIGAGER
jgi:hypothetical protein